MTSVTTVIVVPAFNAAMMIGSTLSALQENPALAQIARVIVLDDCSSDATAEVARSSWHSDTPLEIWCNHKNLGERRTTNAALGRLQDCDWVFILHADDVVKVNWLSLYLDAMSGIPPKVASICSSYDNWWPDESRIVVGEELPASGPVHVRGSRESVIDTIDRGCWWHISGCAIRLSAFREIGGFKADMPQLGDFEWLLRCLSKGFDIYYLPRTTMLYRQHARSVSTRSFALARDLDERIVILKMMLEQGFVSDRQFDLYMSKIARSALRRSLVRVMRRDFSGFCAHSALIFKLLKRRARSYSVNVEN